MAAVMKMFLVLVAFVCCMQLVEMARLRRDEPVKPFDLAATFQEFVKTIENSELMKQIKEVKPEDVQEKLKEGLQKFQDNFGENKEKFETFAKENQGKIETFAKEIIETFNKNTKTA